MKYGDVLGELVRDAAESARARRRKEKEVDAEVERQIGAMSESTPQLLRSVIDEPGDAGGTLVAQLSNVFGLLPGDAKADSLPEAVAQTADHDFHEVSRASRTGGVDHLQEWRKQLRLP